MYSLSVISSLVVGSVFLVTGVVKALAPTRFLIHISQLQLLPPKVNIGAAIAFTILECILGVALILRLFPQWLFLGTIVLLLLLSSLTYWSTSTKRTDDCGCYNGLIDISPKQSLLLNALYITLMGLAWFYPVADILTVSQQVTALLISLTTSCLLTAVSYIYFWKQKKPILNLEPLQVNRRWQPQWLKEYPESLTTGEKLVVFLMPGCPTCKNWLKVLKVVHQRTDLPDVVAGVPQTLEQVQAFVQSNNINFPVVAMSPTVVARLTNAFPTAVLLEEGIIREKWLGVMPLDFVKRVKPNLSVPSGSF
ncbi:MauE/DoxX family redox-associated membrane protein [Nostoc sp. GT001]|uniref:peroxiredoxin family protein n=1 Tax=Nostoc sp. GT001 TaxID=3056647 RepID=UPI0025AA825D|nr:MauE/DoxX family redox-associated membrane protein [Nostoc sp. GT001]MDM9586317.1 redoxin domain-containing protein [Nostoc sp. GT001]